MSMLSCICVFLGKPSLFSLHQCLNHISIVLTNPWNSFLTDRLTTNHTPVVTSVGLHISPQFYTHIRIGVPITARTRLARMRTDSYSYVTELSSAGKYIAKFSHKMKLFNIQSKKVVNLPDTIYDLYSSVVEDRHATFARMPELPEVFYKWQTTLSHTDTDFQYHVNPGIASRLCIDCAIHACADDFYRKLTGDFMQYDVTSSEFLYRAEVFPNDVISVATWQDEKEACVIYFLLVNITSRTVSNKCRFVVHNPWAAKI